MESYNNMVVVPCYGRSSPGICARTLSIKLSHSPPGFTCQCSSIVQVKGVPHCTSSVWQLPADNFFVNITTCCNHQLMPFDFIFFVMASPAWLLDLVPTCNPWCDQVHHEKSIEVHAVMVLKHCPYVQRRNIVLLGWPTVTRCTHCKCSGLEWHCSQIMRTVWHVMVPYMWCCWYQMCVGSSRNFLLLNLNCGHRGIARCVYVCCVFICTYLVAVLGDFYDIHDIW